MKSFIIGPLIAKTANNRFEPEVCRFSRKIFTFSEVSGSSHISEPRKITISVCKRKKIGKKYVFLVFSAFFIFGNNFEFLAKDNFFLKKSVYKDNQFSKIVLLDRLNCTMGQNFRFSQKGPSIRYNGSKQPVPYNGPPLYENCHISS